MGKFLVRLSLLFFFVLIIGYAKFLLVWMGNIKMQGVIFFDLTSKTKEWYSVLIAAFIYVMQIVILVGGGFSVWFLFQIFLDLGKAHLDGYKTEFFFILPLCVIGILNSTYFFYNYVGVYSSAEYDGPRGAPATIEYPSVVFLKADVDGIEKKVAALENDEEYEDEVETRRFLFLGTAAINGYYSATGNIHGIVNYLCSLLAALLEYIFIMMIYLFLPLLCYEIFSMKNGRRNDKLTE